MDIAVIGGGISGLACAWQLRGGGPDGACVARLDGGAPHDVTLYEANDYVGGHAHTVDAEVDGLRHPVDTGFLVFNERTYPRLIALFETLGVATVASEMTFSVQLGGRGTRPIEWAGTDLNAVFVQRRNLVDPKFLRMLADLLRFNRQARVLAAGDDAAIDSWTLGEFLDANRYSRTFRDWYLLPMAAAIWSCSTAQMRDFPLSTFVRFCANHGLLQVADRPQWFTVVGGARNYVDRMLRSLPDVRVATPALSVARLATDSGVKVAVRTARGTALYDHVVLAGHSDDALGVLDDADRGERELLAAIRYQPNRAILHTDATLLPRRRGAWAAWNYECHVGDGSGDGSRDGSRDGSGDGNAELGGSGIEPTAAARSVCVHYLINKLQPVPFRRPVIVSLNPIRPPDPAMILQEFDYAHPLFDGRAIQAQRRLASLQGRGNVWFCGAWTGYGFHEDGLRSGLDVAERIARVGRHARHDEARLAA